MEFINYANKIKIQLLLVFSIIYTVLKNNNYLLIFITDCKKKLRCSYLS